MTWPASVFVAFASPSRPGMRRRDWLWLAVLLSFPLDPALAQAVGPPMPLIGAPTKERSACPSTEFTAFFPAFSTRPELQRRYTKLPLEYGLLDMNRLGYDDEFKTKLIKKYAEIPGYTKKNGAIFPSAAELRADGLEIRITTQKNGQPRENTHPEEIITDPNHATATLILSDGGGLQVYYRFRRTGGCWFLFGISDRST